MVKIMGNGDGKYNDSVLSSSARSLLINNIFDVLHDKDSDTFIKTKQKETQSKY